MTTEESVCGETYDQGRGADSMSTSTEPLTAWEIELADLLLVDVDLTRDVPCSRHHCERPGAWAINPPCGHTRTACDPCRNERDAWFAANPGYAAYCDTCEARVPLPIQWRPL